MADDALKQQEQFRKMMASMADDMGRMQKASRGVTDNFGDLLHHLQPAGLSLKSYLLETVKIPQVIGNVMKGIAAPREALHQQSIEMVKAFKQSRELLKDLRAQLRNTFDPDLKKNLKEAIADEKSKVDVMGIGLRLQRQSVNLHEQATKVFGKSLAIEFVALAGFKQMVSESFELNKAVLDTNSSYTDRVQLFRDTLAVQTRLGAGAHQVVATAKALRQAGFLVRSDFKSTLETVLQMEQGLGISADNATQLARVFQINLATPVRGVADDITKITGATSMAADEAARFATEIGKALRLLGPGGAGQAREVTSYVTMMAARMKDVGGDANEIVKLFSEMTKGTSQGFLLRGRAGVGAPGALGTGGGAQQAMEGIGRVIDQIVRSGPGTRMYAAQLEAAAQMLGVSAESVRLYKDMLAEAKKPLDASVTLQKHWSEQMTQTGQSFSMLLNGLSSLTKRGFVWILDVGVLPLLKGLNWLVQGINNSRLAFWGVTIAMTTGLAMAVVAFSKLTYELAKTTAMSLLLAKAERARRIQEVGLGGLKQEGLFALLGKLGGPLASFSKSISGSSLVRFLAAWSPPVVAVIIAGAVGAAVGLAINEAFWWVKGLFKKEDRFKAIYAHEVSSGNKLTPGALNTMVRHIMTAQGTQAAMNALVANAWRVEGFRAHTKNGRPVSMEETLANYVKNTLIPMQAEVRERRALATVTAEKEETAKRDREAIDINKQQLKAIEDDIPELAMKIESDRKAARQREIEEERQRELLRKTSAALTADPWAASKPFSYHNRYMR